MLLVTLSRLSLSNLFLLLTPSTAAPLVSNYLGSSELSLFVSLMIFFFELCFKVGGPAYLTGVSRNGDSYFSLALPLGGDLVI